MGGTAERWNGNQLTPNDGPELPRLQSPKGATKPPGTEQEEASCQKLGLKGALSLPSGPDTVFQGIAYFTITTQIRHIEIIKAMFKPFLFCVLQCSFVSGAFAQSGDLGNWTWIDLTYPFSAKTLYWPNNPTGFELQTQFEGHTDGGFFYSSYSFCAPEHGGTHLDAPIHFAEGRKTADQITLDQLMGDAVVIDVSDNALRDRDYLFQVSDVLSWEKTHGRLPDGIILLFRTGYGKFYPDPKTYFGTDRKGTEAIPYLHFPGMHPELAQWLVDNRKIKAVGSDNPSIDYGQSTDFLTHQILLGENIPVFENVANLDLLPETRFQIIALPMLIKDGSGGPLRIIAGVWK